MRPHLLKTRQSLACSLLLLLIAIASFGFAQDKPAAKPAAGEERQILQVSLVRVQLGKAGEWQNIVKNEILPVVKKAGVPMYIVMQSEFGTRNEYMIFQPVKDMAQFDEPDSMVKALGQAGADALYAKLDRVTANVRMLAVITRPDLNISPASGFTPKLVAMTRSSVAPGRTQDFEKYTKDMLPILAKTNVKGVLVSRINDGGDPNEYWQSLLVDSYADLGQVSPAFRKAAAEMKPAPLPPGIVTRSERSVWRYVSELSLQASAPKPAK